MNPTTGYCHGCSRTTKEIGDWRNMSDKEKLMLLDELEKRNNELFGD